MAIPRQTAAVSASAGGTTASSTTAWTSALLVGSLVVCNITYTGTSNTPSPTVSSVSLGTDTLSAIKTGSNGTGTTGAFANMYAGVVATAGQTTLSVTVSGSTGINATAGEYPGYTVTTDVLPAAATGSSTTPLTAALAPTTGDVLLISAFAAVANTTASAPTNMFEVAKQVGLATGGSGKNAFGAITNVLGDSTLVGKVWYGGVEATQGSGLTAITSETSGVTLAVTGVWVALAAAFKAATNSPGIIIVQGNENTGTTATTATVSLPAAVNKGDLLLIGIRNNNAGNPTANTVVSITDTISTKFVPITTQVVDGGNQFYNQLYMGYAPANAGAGTYSATSTCSMSTTPVCQVLHLTFSAGYSIFIEGQSQGVGGSTTTAETSGSITTIGNALMVVCTQTWGLSAFTMNVPCNIYSNTNGDLQCWQATPAKAAGSYSITGTFSSLAGWTGFVTLSLMLRIGQIPYRRGITRRSHIVR